MDERVEQHYQALIRGELSGLWPSLLRGALWTLSVPYRWATLARNGMYDRGWKVCWKAPVPVVSVGNLTLGGTGKTPFVEHVAQWFRRQGRRVAILSRGYGSRRGRNDEALVLEHNLPEVPHLQGPDRVALAQVAVEELESEILILDDGFQHRRLARDLDIVLIDATVPWGHGYLFPRGLLREAPGSLRRAGIIVLTRCDQVPAADRGRIQARIARHAPQVPVVEMTHRPIALVNADREEQSLDILKLQSVVAFCGIGNPEAFRLTLAGLGVRLAAFRTFPDHHPYTRQDIDELDGWIGQQGPQGAVLTTQKDLVKIRRSRLGDRPLWALRIQLSIDQGKEVLDRKLQHLLGSRFGERLTA
jgi:tetraacyldisaccharide 4'-kinase